MRNKRAYLGFKKRTSLRFLNKAVVVELKGKNLHFSNVAKVHSHKLDRLYAHLARQTSLISDEVKKTMLVQF